MLTDEGYAHLVNMDGGFSGRRDETGQVLEQGWQACGFPVTEQAEPARTWESLSG